MKNTKYTKKQIDGYDYDRDYFQPIVEVYLLSVNHYKKYFEDLGFNITPVQWHALNRLWNKDGLTQAELAKKIYRDYSYTTRLLDDLQKKGYLERKNDPDDRRVNKIYLTQKGNQFKYEVYPYFLDMAERLRSGLSDSDLSQIRDLCQKLISNYKKYR